MGDITEHVGALDWAVIGLYFVFAIGIALYHSRKATSGMDNYFASGRNASWWLLGTSMVATTFAADTPLAVSGYVVKSGIAMNWFWWSWAMANLLGVFFFARLWKRSGVLTDTELAEVRYGGRSAAFLRGFRGVYFAILYNCIVIGWVNLAMTKLIEHTLGIEKFTALAICFGFSLVYTMLAGLTGVMVTDMVQFLMAMFGAIWLAVAAIRGIGGIGAIHTKLAVTYGADRAADITAMMPAPGSEVFITVMVFIFFQWWTAFNTDSGGYLAQRMIAAKDEKNSFLGLLWFNIAHYCLRPWPWILVGLCAAVLFPYLPDAAGNLPDPEVGYVKVMLMFLPSGMLGLVLASFFAAYMSTIDTHLNWGASYIVNDVYKRFVKRDATDRHYIKVSLAATVFIAVCGAASTMLMQSIAGAWYIVTAIYAGLGVIYILRWYWWRINAWTEISAMISALVFTILFRLVLGTYLMPGFELWGIKWFKFPFVIMVIVPLVLLVSFVTTFATSPVPQDKLVEFYRRVRPGGPGWRGIRKLIPGAEKDPGPGRNLVGYVIAVSAVYCALFGIGKLILGPATAGFALLAGAALLGVALWVFISKQEWEQPGGGDAESG